MQAPRTGRTSKYGHDSPDSDNSSAWSSSHESCTAKAAYPRRGVTPPRLAIEKSYKTPPSFTARHAFRQRVSCHVTGYKSHAPAKEHLRLGEEVSRLDQVDGDDLARQRRRKPNVSWCRAFVRPLDNSVSLHSHPWRSNSANTNSSTSGSGR